MTIDTETTDSAQQALIKVAPERDEAILKLYAEANNLLNYATAREIHIVEDLKPATDDLALISKVRKALEEKKKEYVGPIRAHLDAFNDAFKRFIEPLVQADQINRHKVLAFNAEIARKRAEAEAIEAEKLSLAQREAALNGGEITVDLTPVAKPDEAPRRVSTGMGTASTMVIRKYRVVDFSKLPDQYKIENSALLNKVVKAGIPEIPGVEIYTEETLRVNNR